MDDINRTMKKPSCEQIIDILPDAFVVIDRDYQIISANRKYLDRYHVSADDVVGRFCYEVSHHLDKPCSQHGEHCPLEEVFATRQPTQVMHVHFDKQGHEEYVQLQASPLYDDNGDVMYMGEAVTTLSQRNDESLLIGQSSPMLHMKSLLQRVAPTQTTVLLLGESGVGKERTAEYIHHYSSRHKGPYVVVDCASLGESLIESELFGYEKGAFTGANKQKQGLFEAANGGTLFIDEIGELPLTLQTKMLRVLETGTIRRIGGTQSINVDVRIVAATNRDLQMMVEHGDFRQDLYYRLSAFPVRIPALRDRCDDIPQLAEHLIAEQENGLNYLPLSPQVIEILMQYDYPGNIRELKNILERALILARDEPLIPSHFDFSGPRNGLTTTQNVEHRDLLYAHPQKVTDARIIETLRMNSGHRSKTAQDLGISERTLYRHVKRLKAHLLP